MESMRVNELKEILRALGLHVSGNKTQLIQRLKENGYNVTKRLGATEEVSRGRGKKTKVDRYVDPKWLPPTQILLDILMSNESAMKECTFNTRTNILCVSKLWNAVGKKNFSGIFKFNFPLKVVQAYCATSKDKLESDFQIMKQQNQNHYHHHGVFMHFMPPPPPPPIQPTRYQLLSRVFEFSPVPTFILHLQINVQHSPTPIAVNLCFGTKGSDVVCLLFNQYTVVKIIHSYQADIIPIHLDPSVLPQPLQTRKDKIKWWDRFPLTEVAKHTLVTCTVFGETVKHFFKDNIQDAAQLQGFVESIFPKTSWRTHPPTYHPLDSFFRFLHGHEGDWGVSHTDVNDDNDNTLNEYITDSNNDNNKHNNNSSSSSNEVVNGSNHDTTSNSSSSNHHNNKEKTKKNKNGAGKKAARFFDVVMENVKELLRESPHPNLITEAETLLNQYSVELLGAKKKLDDITEKWTKSNESLSTMWARLSDAILDSLKNIRKHQFEVVSETRTYTEREHMEAMKAVTKEVTATVSNAHVLLRTDVLPRMSDAIAAHILTSSGGILPLYSTAQKGHPTLVSLLDNLQKDLVGVLHDHERVKTVLDAFTVLLNKTLCNLQEEARVKHKTQLLLRANKKNSRGSHQIGDYYSECDDNHHSSEDENDYNSDGDTDEDDHYVLPRKRRSLSRLGGIRRWFAKENAANTPPHVPSISASQSKYSHALLEMYNTALANSKANRHDPPVGASQGTELNNTTSATSTSTSTTATSTSTTATSTSTTATPTSLPPLSAASTSHAPLTDTTTTTTTTALTTAASNDTPNPMSEKEEEEDGNAFMESKCMVIDSGKLYNMLQRKVPFHTATTPIFDLTAAAENTFFAMVRAYHTKTSRGTSYHFYDDSDSDDDADEGDHGKCFFQVWLEDITSHMTKVAQLGDAGNALCFMGQLVRQILADGGSWVEDFAADERCYDPWETCMAAWSIKALEEVTIASTSFLKEDAVIKKWWLFTVQQLLGTELYENLGEIDKQLDKLIDLIESI